MRANSTKVALLILTCLCISSVAFAWGSGTHVYVVTHLNNKGPILMTNQIYGGMGADVFNYMFESPAQMAYLSSETHCDPLPVWRFALLPTAKAQAYGLVSHNNLWAADFYAHNPACPPDPTPTAGYIFDKGALLEQIVFSNPDFGPMLTALGLPANARGEIFRDLTEFGVDILVKRLDPSIGRKVSGAALLRSPEFPVLLVAAYARGLSRNFGMSYQDAARMITAEEAQFRQITISYGQALMQDEDATIVLISEQMAQLAPALLAAFNVQLPPGTDLTPLIMFSITVAVDLCEPDFASELNSTVIPGVKAGLTAHGIVY